MNILILSEMSNDIIWLMNSLQNYAIRMDCISNGFAALQAMKKHNYYTVIISAEVANHNGVFIAKQLQKENPSTKNFDHERFANF